MGPVARRKFRAARRKFGRAPRSGISRETPVSERSLSPTFELPSLEFHQRSPRHLHGLRQSHQRKERGRNVLERAAVGDRRGPSDVDARHAEERVRRVRLAGLVVEHLLGVAVVGGDEELPADGTQRGVDAPEALVERLDGLDGGVEVARVTHHVAVGEVADDRVVLAGCDRGGEPVGDFVARSFRASSRRSRPWARARARGLRRDKVSRRRR